jgi:hypothetical protein
MILHWISVENKRNVRRRNIYHEIADSNGDRKSGSKRIDNEK